MKIPGASRQVFSDQKIRINQLTLLTTAVILSTSVLTANAASTVTINLKIVLPVVPVTLILIVRTWILPIVPATEQATAKTRPGVPVCYEAD